MNIKRMRGRNNHRNGNGGTGGAPIRHHSGGTPLNRNHVFDSNGPDLRIRGTSQQLFEKYLQLGRDATSSGDRVMAESYFQHAEHYFRILNAMNLAAQQNQPNGYQNGQPRRLSNSDSDEPEPMPPGSGDQPGGEPGEPGSESNGESREIPIAAGAPEA
ncbi:MAG TPA: DUF4167 domain-containing protein [Acetobacteraceae bacterium]|nr:DUF4167 domain-containing protein [Acetobacteraceae bacterium]